MRTFVAACILAVTAMATEDYDNYYLSHSHSRRKSPDEETVEALEQKLQYYKWQCKSVADSLESEYQSHLVPIKQGNQRLDTDYFYVNDVEFNIAPEFSSEGFDN